ncbi:MULTISPECIES: YbhB/YbcL family Raf kinase inhibitor-like protein [unclassified Rhizobium]|uniref:YbhB/YbcL family Raf kinase inhibitor-like protein n=1 Tax=unclassified Rhizobium TaxID=2613769 RepID=UPI001AD9E3D1|nr:MULTISPECIES: YbhB/YbcL family Raf kinase inhibitor-like protein [unclassified Rhizobium]MBO9097739.1 YbhB/YbcL family Raf kinase inhibitor-like protein [Rhizobium sp. L58/93]MBO9133478.1 YbhB/YbcL family Raf kinase inhibitor-like protein [Rhizobium sp. B209b/85]MBO9167889.1 YbhB/YbcL family Raf kinase inhibitor-like protein [Rhizobium sp. L245/93]MBO9183934.1 YbhB/YbcL family Raf kinase inhibitor-like protein [Rhizobium sp. E27B/91]QXZ84169.1 YbhB/YbcL family Raf kinase inhibitor-like prot
MRTTNRFPGAIVLAAVAGLILSASAIQAFAADLAVSFGKAEPGRMLPPANAACVVHQGKLRPGRNESPSLSWSKGPAGTKSYAVTMVDPDVPVDRSGFNRDDTVIAETAPREEFVHWVLADIPSDFSHLPEAIDGNGVTKAGLPLKRTDHGRRGQNGFGEGSLKNGPQGGYHGACPPWNDQRVHHYRVTVYALDVEHLGLPDAFTRSDLLRAADGHILSSGSAELRYTLNARARE